MKYKIKSVKKQTKKAQKNRTEQNRSAGGAGQPRKRTHKTEQKEDGEEFQRNGIRIVCQRSRSGIHIDNHWLNRCKCHQTCMDWKHIHWLCRRRVGYLWASWSHHNQLHAMRNLESRIERKCRRCRMSRKAACHRQCSRSSESPWKRWWSTIHRTRMWWQVGTQRQRLDILPRRKQKIALNWREQIKNKASKDNNTRRAQDMQNARDQKEEARGNISDKGAGKEERGGGRNEGSRAENNYRYHTSE